jgi:hypothetical protein
MKDEIAQTGLHVVAVGCWFAPAELAPTCRMTIRHAATRNIQPDNHVRALQENVDLPEIDPLGNERHCGRECRVRSRFAQPVSASRHPVCTQSGPAQSRVLRAAALSASHMWTCRFRGRR